MVYIDITRVIQGKFKLVESIFDVIYTKISFVGLTPRQQLNLSNKTIGPQLDANIGTYH